MAFVVKKDESFDPGNIGYFGSVGKMLQATGSCLIFKKKGSQWLWKFGLVEGIGKYWFLRHSNIPRITV